MPNTNCRTGPRVNKSLERINQVNCSWWEWCCWITFDIIIFSVPSTVVDIRERVVYSLCRAVCRKLHGVWKARRCQNHLPSRSQLDPDRCWYSRSLSLSTWPGNQVALGTLLLCKPKAQGRDSGWYDLAQVYLHIRKKYVAPFLCTVNAQPVVVKNKERNHDDHNSATLFATFVVLRKRLFLPHTGGHTEWRQSQSCSLPWSCLCRIKWIHSQYLW